MRSKRAFMGLVVVGLALAACGHSSSSTDAQAGAGDSKAEERDAENEKKVRQRAAFDLGCPEDKVIVTVIEEGTMWKPATFGAVGCDQRATYLWRMGTILRQ